MSRVEAWGTTDGRRKSRYTIRCQIERMLEAMTPSVWFEPYRDRYIGSYEALRKEASGVTCSHNWDEAQIVDFVKRLFSKQNGGWMARAGHCDINHQAAARLAAALNSFDNSDKALSNLVTIASSLVNNSMVGSSKFLHFCLPHFFAITDQYLRLVSATPANGDPTTQAAYYRTYMAALNLVNPECATQAEEWAEKVFGYSVTRIRAIEAFVFYHAREFDQGRLPALRVIMGREPRRPHNTTRKRCPSCPNEASLGANAVV